MLDGTQSVGAKNYQQMKLFSYELTKAYEVSEELVHFGLIYYGNYSYLDFKFSDEEFWDPDVLRTEIQMNEYVDGMYVFFYKNISSKTKIQWNVSSLHCNANSLYRLTHYN